MKRLLVLFSVFFLTTTLNAETQECDYTRKKDLNTLAMYVDTTYDYKGNGTFDVSIINLTDELEAYLDLDLIDKVDNKSVINNLAEGTELKVKISGTLQSYCGGLELRIITVRVPYVNPFYGSNSCIGYENLNVCNREFLNYKVDEDTFNSIISNANKSNIDVPDDNDNNIITPEKTFWEKALDFVYKYYVIEISLVIVSSLITYKVYSAIYRKVKHGL